MNNLSRMRLGVLRELKQMRRFLDHMERGVKQRDPEATQKAYLFLKTMVYHMDEGDLTPLAINLHKELLLAQQEE